MDSAAKVSSDFSVFQNVKLRNFSAAEGFFLKYLKGKSSFLRRKEFGPSFFLVNNFIEWIKTLLYKWSN